MGKKRHRIAYVLTPITFGGSEKVSLTFLKYVDREKFDIEPILFLRPWENRNFFEEEIRRLEFKTFSIPVSKSVNGELFRVPRCLMNLKEIVGKGNYDLVHTHGYLADLLGLTAARVSGLSVVSTCHGFINGGWKLSLYNRLDIEALAWFDRVIAVSDSISNGWLQSRVKPEKITIIENCASPLTESALITSMREKKRGLMQIAADEILLGFFGRLSSEKGIVYLLEALKLLQDTELRVKLVLLGEGSQRTELEEIVRRDRLSEQVIFAGFEKKIEEWMAATDIFVLPSLTEGTPMALLEAMSFGLPCIASAVGGVPKVIESGEDGILVAPGNPSQIRDAVLSICNDDSQRDSISRKARQKIERNYDAGLWARRIENEYLRILYNA